jgi:hypothetical protein
MAKKKDKEDDFITIDEVAARLGIPVEELEREIRGEDKEED